MNSEQAKALKHSELWEEFCKYLNSEIEKIKEQMIFCQEYQAILRRQEQIKTIRSVMNIPDEIIESGE